MFEDYLKDSNEFYLIATDAKSKNEIDSARRYYRVSIMCAFNAIESFVNYIAKSFEEADNLEKLEICFLNDKELYFSPTKGICTRTKFTPIDEKLKVLIKRFNSTYDFEKSAEWGNLKSFKDFRDSLVHSRKSEDETSLDEYERRVKIGNKSVIEIMNLISQGMYHQPLRKNLLDLIPE
ncbi:MAG TPA: hypothetical protein VJL10_05330 [Anaerolineales bacterium]|nr:hypothetical protein [Anaerolineales bacterium]